MRRDIAQIIGLRQRLDQAAGPHRPGGNLADQAGADAGHQATQGGGDAATFGIAQQRRDAGRAGHADLDRRGNAAGAQMAQPGDYPVRRKGKLAYNVGAQALCRGAGDFLVKRRFETARRNAGMTFRMGGNADLVEAEVAQTGFLNHGQRVGEGTAGLDVAADHQQLLHGGLAAQRFQQFLQLTGAGEASRRDMGDRLKTGLAQMRGRPDQFGGVHVWNRGEIDRRARLQHPGQRRDLSLTRTRRLDGEGRGEGLAIVVHDKSPGRMAYSRRREITKDSS